MLRWLLTLVALTAGCSSRPLDLPSENQQTRAPTEMTIVDACLHWTSCVTQPRWPLKFSDCVEGFTAGGSALAWPGDAVAVTSAQLLCLAAAGLDCQAALDCVSSPAPTPCPSPTWRCDGDTVTRCDDFGGSRVVTENCAASGLHCLTVGDEAVCGLEVCDAASSAESCDGTRATACTDVRDADGVPLGNVRTFTTDCAVEASDCFVNEDGFAECAGKGPACDDRPGNFALGCQGDSVIVCEPNGRQGLRDCSASGLQCISFDDGNPSGILFGCAGPRGLVDCLVDQNFGSCEGTTLQYCDELGNERLDCVERGYSDCQDGHCVP